MHKPVLDIATTKSSKYVAPKDSKPMHMILTNKCALTWFFHEAINRPVKNKQNPKNKVISGVFEGLLLQVDSACICIVASAIINKPPTVSSREWWFALCIK